MTNIYSDIKVYKMKSESGDEEIHIHDGTNHYHPNLILPNLLAVKKLRDYLDKVCNEPENRKVLNNWFTANGLKAKNVEYWKELDLLLNNRYIEFQWVKGHRDHIENKLCDYYARLVAERGNL